jgi:hypothetical protein
MLCQGYFDLTSYLVNQNLNQRRYYERSEAICCQLAIYRLLRLARNDEIDRDSTIDKGAILA